MLNILVPAAGASAHFKTPKPFIDLRGRPLIERVLENIGRPCSPYAQPVAPSLAHPQLPVQAARHIILILREHLDIYATYLTTELARKLTAAGFGAPVFVPVPGPTDGAASTCLLATRQIDNDQPLLIANCQQFIAWSPYDFVSRAERDHLDGIILTHTAKPAGSGLITLAASGLVASTHVSSINQSPINPGSDLAPCGLYFWTRGRDFVRTSYEMIAANDRVKTDSGAGHFHILPAYNYLIARSARIGIEHVEDYWPIITQDDLDRYLKITGYQ